MPAGLEAHSKKESSSQGRFSAWTRMVHADFTWNKSLYFMALFGLAYYVIFYYIPMYGVIIAFKDFSPAKGVLDSAWVGLKHFYNFFGSYYFVRIITNTFMLSVFGLIFGFPAPIFLALMLNEVKSTGFKRTVQTITYLPHFISLIVICGMIVDFTAQDGFINVIVKSLGYDSGNLLLQPGLFKAIYVSTDIWQSVGWGSIIYLAAITNIDQEMYDAAKVDGAGKWKQMLYITLPGIMPTIIILLILRIGSMMNVGFEKIILLYNPLTYVTADVISSFVYRKGILEANYSYSTAVGLFNSLVNFALLVSANKISRRVSNESLW